MLNAIVLSLSLVGFVAAQTPDETALRELVRGYFATYAAEDVEGHVKLWSEQSPAYASRRGLLRQLFASADYTFTAPQISRVSISGKQAEARVTTERTAVREGGNGNVTKMVVNFSFVKEGNRWKFTREAPAVGELLNALNAAQTDADRAELLTADRDLLNRDFLFLLRGQSDRAFAQGNLPLALNTTKTILRTAETLGDKPEISAAWRNLGNIHFLQRNYPASIEAYQKSLVIEEESGQKAEAAKLIASIGYAYAAQENYRAALDHYQRSLTLSESIGDRAGVAGTLENIGEAHYQQHNFKLAAEFYQKSLDLRDAAKEHAAIAATLLNLAKVQYDQGHDDEALGFYRRAIALLEPLGGGVRASLAYALHTAANLYYVQGDYDLALAYYQRAVAAQERVGSQQGVAAALLGSGQIFVLQANYPAALAAYQRMLAVQQLAGAPAEQAAAWQRLGGVYFAQGLISEALEHYRRALALREELKDKVEIGWALLDVGLALTAQKNYAEALEHFQTGRAAFAEAKEQSGVGSALLNTSLVHYERKEFPRALELAEQATALAQQHELPEIFWQARLRAGKANFRLQQYPPARQALTEAITAIENRTPQPTDYRQQRLFESKVSPYLAMVDVLMAQEQINDALNYAERAKARGLWAMLQSGKSYITKTMTPKEVEREQQLSREQTALGAQMHRERERPRPNQTRLAELTAQWRKAAAALTAYQTQLYRLHPDLKLLRGEAPALNAAQAGALVGNANTALLVFTATDEQIYLFVQTKPVAGKTRAATAGQYPPLTVYALGIQQNTFAASIERLQQQIANREEGWEQLAQGFFKLLLKPAWEQLAAHTQLVIVPDGLLWNVPFAALQTEDKRCVIDSHALSFAPSLTALQAMNNRRAPIAPRAAGRAPTPSTSSAPSAQAAQASLLAFANPVLSPPATERLKAARLTETIKLALETEKEIEVVSKLFGAAQSRALLGAEAREDRARTEAAKYRVLHLAVPASLNELSPLFSHLVLSPVEGDAAATGLIEARRLMQWDWRNGLAVFSASEVTPKRFGGGRGLTGFSWALFVAGRPAALLGQWRVESPSTTDLMLNFHGLLKASAPTDARAKAWQAAVVKLRQNDEYRHPFYWAGFVLMGAGW